MGSPLADMMTAREAATTAEDPLADVCFWGTVDGDVAAMRVLALRSLDAYGIGVVVSRTSPKWRQMSLGGKVAVLLYWATVGRQFRVTGVLAEMPASILADQWAKKGRRARLLEHYYDVHGAQTSPVPSRVTLEAGMAELEQRFDEVEDVPMPDSVVGLVVTPTEVEVWHDREDRLHDRWMWRLIDGVWARERLVP